jgi:sulfate adenylyltransferase large subunit
VLSSLTHNSARADFAEFLEQDLNTELLRFTTAGSVDDGKSTLIGRLLHDSKSVYEDQLASVKKSRVNRSSGPIDFSLLTDGLRAEREQGITIDVAYRYFATSRRKFIIADTPGHEQYTRNMATGASTADLAVILIDATKGILAQTRRHAFIASLLGIRNVLAAVNKMDLVEYREEVFVRLQEDFLLLARQLGIAEVQCIPISALEGDNVVERSGRTRWYQGPTMLEHLETVPLPPSDSPENLRFPVQTVIRPDAGFRGFAGRVASGVIRPGDAVLALPSGQKTQVEAIVTYDGNLPEAFAPMSVTLQLKDEIDLSRGDMLVSLQNPPRMSKTIHAMVVWLHSTPLEVGKTYLVKHTARQTKIRAVKIRHRVNVNTLAHEAATQLQMNEIAALELEVNVPLFFDAYSRNRTTGSFILIDPLSNATVGAGMIQEDDSTATTAEDGGSETPSRSRARTTAQTPVTPQERYERHGHYPGVLLLEGRRELAARLERTLFDKGFELLHFTATPVAPDAFADVLRLAQSTGIVVIYSGETLTRETKQRIAAEFGTRVFDAAATHLPSDDNEVNRQALIFAQSLLLVDPKTNRRKVN